MFLRFLIVLEDDIGLILTRLLKNSVLIVNRSIATGVHAYTVHSEVMLSKRDDRITCIRVTITIFE